MVRRRTRRGHIALREIVSFARETFLRDKVRFSLTALGMLIGTASVILVATISLAGKQYLLQEIRSIGSNWINVELQGFGGSPVLPSDNLSLADMDAVVHQVQGIAAASPVFLPLIERVSIGNGKVRALQVTGVYPEYAQVRNLIIVSGRFFDRADVDARNKVGIITAKLAKQLYGSAASAPGKTVEINGLPFTVIGTFRESVDTFSQSEVTDVTMLVPHTVVRYVQQPPTVKQLFFSAADPALVPSVSAAVARVIRSRHRPEAVYNVRNLTQLLTVAGRTSNAMTLLLLAVASVMLIVSGISIMNIMLDAVRERVREIGVRKACGATKGDIQLHFFSEAFLISMIGGALGIAVGLAIPLFVRLLTPYRIPISGMAAVIAVLFCSLVGILFGTIPAVRAAQLNPAESLRHE